MKKQLVNFRLVGQSENGLPIYELDNSALNGQRSLPESFRATIVFLPTEATNMPIQKAYESPQKTYEVSEREYDLGPQREFDLGSHRDYQIKPEHSFNFEDDDKAT